MYFYVDRPSLIPLTAPKGIPDIKEIQIQIEGAPVNEDITANTTFKKVIEEEKEAEYLDVGRNSKQMLHGGDIDTISPPDMS